MSEISEISVSEVVNQKLYVYEDKLKRPVDFFLSTDNLQPVTLLTNEKLCTHFPGYFTFVSRTRKSGQSGPGTSKLSK